MLNPYNAPLLKELSVDKLKKFELAASTLPYASDMLLCRIPVYVKSTMVDKLALDPIEIKKPTPFGFTRTNLNGLLIQPLWR